MTRKKKFTYRQPAPPERPDDAPHAAREGEGLPEDPPESEGWTAAFSDDALLFWFRGRVVSWRFGSYSTVGGTGRRVGEKGW